MNIPSILAFKFPTASPLTDVIVADEGHGPFIAKWNLLATQPTQADLATIEASAEYQAWIAPAAVQARINAQYPERTALRNAAAQAVADIDTYLAIASPTNAQVVAAVRRMVQTQEQIIKFLIKVDG